MTSTGRPTPRPARRSRACGASQGDRCGPGPLPVLRVKNKFAFAAAELRGGYRDLMLSGLYQDPGSRLGIIGEIQAPAALFDRPF